MHVISQENATWQGQVTWLDKKETMSFRSLLELIKLMDDALMDGIVHSGCGEGRAGNEEQKFEAEM